MAITKYSRVCGKNTPGNHDILFLAPKADIESFTITDGEVSAVTMVIGKKFKQIQADIDGVQFTSEGTGKTSYRETQSLLMRFSKKTKTLIALKEELTEEIACGIVAIRVDANGQAFLSGYSVPEGLSRPYNEIESNFDSGREPSDDDVQMYTITIKRIGGYDEIPFNTATNATILSGMADFIDWT